MQEITEEVQKQVEMLESLGINDAKVAEGDSISKRKHYFDHIVSTISKEVIQIMKTIKKIMHLPAKYDKKKGDESVIGNFFKFWNSDIS
jgi:hypothetical protein